MQSEPSVAGGVPPARRSGEPHGRTPQEDPRPALQDPLAELLADRTGEHALRLRVPGCSAGDEACSLASLLRERLDQLERPLGVQIFAPDLDPRSIDLAPHRREDGRIVGVASGPTGIRSGG